MFRVYDLTNKKLYKVKAIHFNRCGGINEIEVYDNVGSFYKDCGSDIVLMQSTNLYDKDDNEIYEGDVVEYNSEIWYIERHNSQFILSKYLGTGEYKGLEMYHKDLKVLDVVYNGRYLNHL